MERVLLALAQDLFIRREREGPCRFHQLRNGHQRHHHYSRKWVALSTRCKSSRNKYVFCLPAGSPISLLSINKQAEVSERKESHFLQQLMRDTQNPHLFSSFFPVPPWGRNTWGRNLFRLKRHEMKASLRFDAHSSPYTDLISSAHIQHPAFLPVLPSTQSFSSRISSQIWFATHPTNSCVSTMWGMKAIWGEKKKNQPDFVVPSVRPVSLASRLCTPPHSTARSSVCCWTQPCMPNARDTGCLYS